MGNHDPHAHEVGWKVANNGDLFSWPHILFATTNHSFGPPSWKLLSFGSARTSYCDGSMDSITQPSAEASSIFFRLARRGPWSPGSESEKHSRNNRPPGFSTECSPSTYRRRSSSEKTWNRPESITFVQAPYFIWVSIAAILQLSITVMN